VLSGPPVDWQLFTGRTFGQVIRGVPGIFNRVSGCSASRSGSPSRTASPAPPRWRGPAYDGPMNQVRP